MVLGQSLNYLPAELVMDLCYFNFRRGLHSDRTIIHTNLLTSIAISQTVFLAGVEQTASKVRQSVLVCIHTYVCVYFCMYMCMRMYMCMYVIILVYVYVYIWLDFRKGYRQLQAQCPEYPPPLPNFPVPSSYKNGNCLNIRTSLDISDNIHPRK